MNAYALAATLVALADSAKAAARTLNSAVEVEIVVEALNSGSFRAKITAIARETGLFIKNQVLTSVLIGVLSAYIYDHTLSKKEPVEVIVQTDEVIVVQGNDRIVVPRAIHEAEQLVRKDPVFVRSMDRMLGSAVLDDRVTGFGIAPSLDSPPPQVILNRELLEMRDPLEPEPKSRIVEEEADLYIVKAIMERSTRKWEFKWHGVNISAPIALLENGDTRLELVSGGNREVVSGEVVMYRHLSRPRPGNLVEFSPADYRTFAHPFN